MKQQFVETIKIKDGKVYGIAYNQARMERTMRHFFPHLCMQPIPLLEDHVVPNDGMDFYKARVVYGENGVEKIEYAPYSMREIRSLQIVEDNDIEYSFKSTDRSCLDALSARKGNCDEIIIVKQGLVCDTSFTNLAIYDGIHWLTPCHPLLAGTKRASLLDKGIIKEGYITMDDLRKAKKLRLFNAMIEFGEMEVPIKDVHF